MPELANLPDAIDNDDAVRMHGFADVPGTTLTVHLADDADAFDMSRVVAMVDDYGYDLADSTEVDWVAGSHVVLTFDHVRPPESDDVDDGDDDTGRDDLMTPSDAEIAEAFGVDDVDEITDEMVEDATADLPDPPERVDVSDYKTAAGAAKATAKALREWADFYGYNPDDVLLYDPEECARKRDVTEGVWCVAWEGGFFEWAVALTGGESMTSNEGYGRGGDPEVAGLLDGAGFDVECYYSFDLLFYNR